MRHRIVLTLLAFFPLCAIAQGNTSSSEDLKVTLKAEPGYKKQKRVVKTWSIYPARRVVYEAPKAEGSKTNNQALLTKTYVDPTQKRMPASGPIPVVAKQGAQPKAVVAKANVKAFKPATVPKSTAVAKAPVMKANRAPASVAVAKAPVKAAPVKAVAIARQQPQVDTVVQAPAAKPLVLESMSFKVAKSKPVQKRQISNLSPYQAGMSKVTRASLPKKSSGLVGRQKIAYNK
ncbi:hypothetical protein DOM22_02295 [Bdellovibrio sp. ZAP7]|uniref:hypothetical protein n=1 Tax=Bdellovibrio sp. ZAP7 TaxID=2231053 RepID=UPI001159B27C|nr:hypothetical protein [Bdellovibrio sp. ZAP7]QDK44071.1 hypothetical protein DOM22_02295 [Bdellovibrio sp. ZAP7]